MHSLLGPKERNHGATGAPYHTYMQVLKKSPPEYESPKNIKKSRGKKEEVTVTGIFSKASPQ